MTIRWLFLGMAVAVGTGWFPETAHALPPREACLTCHASADIARMDPPRGGSIRVEGTTLQNSVHARVPCAGCHAGARSIPHAEKLPPVRCASCHREAAAEVSRSVHGEGAVEAACRGCHGAHGVAPAERVAPGACVACHGVVVEQYLDGAHGARRVQGDREVATCGDCHGPVHGMLGHHDPVAPTNRTSLAETCARCHADRELATRRKIPIPAAVALYRGSVHGRSDDPRAATCNDCHESHALRRATDPAASIHRDNIPETCGRCHDREAREYRKSVHGTAAARGVRASPVCTDCHGEHRVRGPRDPDSPVAPSGVTATCSHCHEAIGIRETYGLPAGRLSTYLDSYHGLAARGGSPVAANCASCHGHHDILPSGDPASAIHPSNLPSTCGQCHPGAGERFARGAVHVVMARPDRPVLHVVRLLYLWLIGLTIGAMAIHNGLDFARKLNRRLREHLRAAAARPTPTGRWFARMTVAERLQHGLLAISFVVLVYTGFALKFPEAWAFAWLARLEHGYEWRSWIHRVAAIVMVATAVFHLGHLLTARGRGLLAALLPRPVDVVQAGQNFLYLVGIRREPPRFDRFGYIEKAEYWALVWGTVIMTVTGFALWFENWSLQWVDKWVLDLATLIHYYEAWLAFLAILVWHMYQTVLNPDVYPMNWTWLTGRITEEQLRHEHAAEWERLTAEEAADSGDVAAAGETAVTREDGPSDDVAPAGDSLSVRDQSSEEGGDADQRDDHQAPDPGEAPDRSP